MSIWWSLERNLATFCLGFCRWFPRVSVNLLVAWAAWAYLQTALVAPGPGPLRFLMVLVGFTLTGLILYTYAALIAVGPGSPLDIPELIGDEEADAVPEIIRHSVTAKQNGKFRYCSKCKCWKPDRTHHCSTCRRCFLKMDHHCPWFSACVGFNNHKYFLQLQYYVVAFCFVTLCVGLITIMTFVRAGAYESEYLSISTVIVTVMAGAFGVAIGAFCLYSTWLVANNKTTLEMMEDKAIRTALASQQYRYREAPSTKSLGNVFDLGRAENLKQVFGSTWLEWLLPVPVKRPPSFNGASFPIDKDLYNQAQERAATEMALLTRQRH